MKNSISIFIIIFFVFNLNAQQKTIVKGDSNIEYMWEYDSLKKSIMDIDLFLNLDSLSNKLYIYNSEKKLLFEVYISSGMPTGIGYLYNEKNNNIESLYNFTDYGVTIQMDFFKNKLSRIFELNISKSMTSVKIFYKNGVVYREYFYIEDKIKEQKNYYKNGHLSLIMYFENDKVIKVLKYKRHESLNLNL